MWNNKNALVLFFNFSMKFKYFFFYIVYRSITVEFILEMLHLYLRYHKIKLYD